MACRLSKLRPKIVFSCVVVFFSLSASVWSAEQRTRCYWCGPLAEQVHRSQRAPSCDIFNLEQHETLCDQGYTHCAIVAVSPPYAESRLCVKFYQDECYSLYCNSTKTWRMVCACRGDLCNGPHSDRETQAFALLPKFIKTKPRKRNLVSQFINIKTRKPTDDTVIIISNETETNYSIQRNQPNENNSNHTPTPKRAEDNIIIVHGTLTNDEKDMNDGSSETENNDESKIHNLEATPTHLPTPLESSKTDNKPEKADVDKHLDNTQGKHLGNSELGIIKHLNTSKVDKRVNAEVGNNLNKSEASTESNAEMDKPMTVTTTSAAEVVVESQHSAETSTTTTKSIVTIAVAVQSSVASRKMPPAEALQQNVTPTKAMELTTLGTVTMSIENNIMETTMAPKANNPNKKNSVTQNTAHFITFVIFLLVHYCI